MFSITPSEMLTIAVVALIVLGPNRLVAIARKAGRVVGELRRTSEELKAGLQKEIEDVAAPFREAKSELAAAGKELKESADGQLVWVDKADTKKAAGPGPAGPAPQADTEAEQASDS